MSDVVERLEAMAKVYREVNAIRGVASGAIEEIRRLRSDLDAAREALALAADALGRAASVARTYDDSDWAGDAERAEQNTRAVHSRLTKGDAT